ncbi:MAG TPA: hypothetical protein VJ955_05945 [Desulfuromonadales bacterium]|nr:hypothetical protein [Desulfuromonadales bacterium]
MQCPVCKSHKYTEIDLHAEGFSENILECKICGTVWAVNHGTLEIVKDAQAHSFLEATSECVESDDYSWVA